MKHETHFIKKLEKQAQPCTEIWPVYIITQDNFFYHKILWKMWSGNKFQALFSFQRILCKKESEEASMLIWTNFDSFAIAYVI